MIFALAYSGAVLLSGYVFLGALFGEWRKSFDEYEEAPWAFVFCALAPPVAVAATAFFCLVSCAFDWDWPLRIKYNGNRGKEEDLPRHFVPFTSVPNQHLVQQLQQQQQMSWQAYQAHQNALGAQLHSSSGFGLQRASGVQTGYRHPRHPDYPNTFGWRAWRWDPDKKLLCSPQQGTPWHGSELRVEEWNEQAVVRGVSGIHAELVPADWETRISEYASDGGHGLTLPHGGAGGDFYVQHGQQILHFTWDLNADVWRCSNGQFYTPGAALVLAYGGASVHGIAERFGKYVLGTEGWRAEWAVIRKLLAPDTETGLALEQAYPDVEVIYPKGAA